MKVKKRADVTFDVDLLAELDFFFDGFELNLCYCNPKDVDLYMRKLKPKEIWVEDWSAF